AALHFVGSREVLDKALAVLGSSDPRARARAVDILGQLGIPERSFPEECVTAAIMLVRQDADPLVLQSAAYALGHLRDPRCVQDLAKIAGNPDPEVRQAIAFALVGRTEPDAISTLIHLTRDQDAHVRDW